MGALNDADLSKVPRQVPLAPIQKTDSGVLDALTKQIVCHAHMIRGFVNEHADAVANLGLTYKDTRDIRRLRAYVTAQGGCLYIHSNYLKDGCRYPTKIATNLDVDLFTLFVNLVFLGLPTEAQLASAAQVHMNQAGTS